MLRLSRTLHHRVNYPDNIKITLVRHLTSTLPSLLTDIDTSQLILTLANFGVYPLEITHIYKGEK
jgi:hypothetical protein